MDKEEILPIRREREEVVLSLCSLEVYLLNQSPIALKIGCLANPLKNSAFTVVLIIAASSNRLRSLALAVAALPLLNVIGSHTILPALTNALFTIHPPMLYVCAALTISALAYSGRRATSAYLAAWALSILMGGFWSMQELSWGGWWNWDVIECGVAYQWALAAYLSHRSYKGASLALASSLSVSLAVVVYTLLNKLGVGVSIHSFVTSKAVQSNYGQLWAVALCASLLLLPSLGSLPAFWLAVLLFFYSGTRSFSIIKPAVLWLIFSMAPPPCRRHAVTLYHRLYYAAAVGFASFNFDNSAFFFCFSPRKVALSLTCSHSFWHLDFVCPLRQKIVWEGLWLSKPRYLYSLGLESWSTRSISLRSAYSVFLK